MDSEPDFRACLACKAAAARREAQRLSRHYDALLRPHDLSIAQYTLLVHLVLGGPTAMTTLAARLGLERTTLTRNVALAEQRGLVLVAAGEDLRERVVAISPAGRIRLVQAFPAWERAQATAGG